MNPFEEAQYHLLRFACRPHGQGICHNGPRKPIQLSSEFLSETWLENADRALRELIGAKWADYVRGKSVVDFGCGDGRESVQIALAGAERVIGIDIEPVGIATARRFAEEASVADRCTFVTEIAPDVRTDVIISLNAFEHFADPAAILASFRRILKPNGIVLVGFGPSWYHPYGSHVCPFPWAHLIMSEPAIMRWRSLYWAEDARTFREVGVHHLSISQFIRVVREGGFGFQRFETKPIRKMKWIHCKLTREFTTTTVHAILTAR